MISNIPFLLLNNGNKIPIMAIGTGTGTDPNLTIQIVENSLDLGYRHIDCAFFYRNEKQVGDAIKNKISEGVVKREDLFITSKEGDDLCPTDAQNQVIHCNYSYLDTWRAMEKLVDEGLTKSIGVSNFNSQQIEDILSIARIKPVINQVECHPYLNQKKLKAFCENRNILIMGFSPLGSPNYLSNSSSSQPILEDLKLQAIAKKYNKTVAQIALKYQVQRGIIVVTKSSKKSRMISNADIFDFTLNDEDVKTIDSLDNGNRLFTLLASKNDKYYPYNLEF